MVGVGTGLLFSPSGSSGESPLKIISFLHLPAVLTGYTLLQADYEQEQSSTCGCLSLTP